MLSANPSAWPMTVGRERDEGQLYPPNLVWDRGHALVLRASGLLWVSQNQFGLPGVARHTQTGGLLHQGPIGGPWRHTHSWGACRLQCQICNIVTSSRRQHFHSLG